MQLTLLVAASKALIVVHVFLEEMVSFCISVSLYVHTYCKPLGAVSMSISGLWVVLFPLFPPKLSAHLIPEPVRSVYPGGRLSNRAEQSRSDRRVSFCPHRHVSGGGETALMLQWGGQTCSCFYGCIYVFGWAVLVAFLRVSNKWWLDILIM